MGHRGTLIAVIVFAAMACGSSKKDSNTEPDASLLGSGGSSVSSGSGGSSGSGSGGTSSNGTGTGTGSGTGGSAAAGTGGTGANGGMMTAGTGGRGGFMRGDGGVPMMLMCPATQPMDGTMCMGGGFGGRGMSCMFGDTSCRCRRGMWRCGTPMMPPADNDGGM